MTNATQPARALSLPLYVLGVIMFGLGAILLWCFLGLPGTTWNRPPTENDLKMLGGFVVLALSGGAAFTSVSREREWVTAAWFLLVAASLCYAMYYSTLAYVALRAAGSAS